MKYARITGKYQLYERGILSTHEHNHHEHAEASWGKRLIVSMFMNLIIPAVQIYGGIVSGSMALISDALHNLSDFVSLVINYAALLLGRRGPTPSVLSALKYLLR